MVALEEFKIAVIHPVQHISKPHIAYRSNRKFLSTVSKEFEKSTLRMLHGILCFCKLKINSLTTTILSRIHHCLRNVDCEISTKESMTRLSREAKIL